MPRSPNDQSALRRTARWLGEGFLGLLYPARCLACGNLLPEATLPACPRCLQRLARAEPADVRARFVRLQDEDEAVIVPEHAFALWHFTPGGTLQAVQHLLKYGNRPRYGPPLGRMLGAAYREAAPLPDAVVPLPLHAARRYARGYNQSALLAQGVAEALGRPLAAGLLTRRRPTRSQTRLGRAERHRNVAGAFMARAQDAQRGQRLLIVDDVLTTGATAAAACAALRDAGASAVDLVVLALARA